MHNRRLQGAETPDANNYTATKEKRSGITNQMLMLLTLHIDKAKGKRKREKAARAGISVLCGDKVLVTR